MAAPAGSTESSGTASASASVMSSADFASMSIRDLKTFLAVRGVDTSDCLEKRDLVVRCCENAEAVPTSISCSDAAAAAKNDPNTCSSTTAAASSIVAGCPSEEQVAAARKLLSGRLRGGINRERIPLLGQQSKQVEVTSQTTPSDSDEIDLLVIVLHGYGANQQDLVPLSQQLILQQGLLEVGKRDGSSATGGRICFAHPNGIQELGGGARAWWDIDMAKLMQGDYSRFVEPPVGLDAARAAILEVIAALRAAANDLPLERVILAGFSQGAMLATDIALTLGAEGNDVGGLIVFSGLGIARDEWAAKAAAIAARRAKSTSRALRVLQTHGSEDPILPFSLGKGLSEFLREALEADLEFVSFRGGHTIASDGVRKMGTFLSAMPLQKL